MPMDGILLEPKGGYLGKELGEETGVVQEPQPRRRILDRQQLVELVPDPLGRHDRQPVAEPAHGIDEIGVGHELVAGDEPGGPHHPKGIVGEGLLRRQRGPQSPVVQIGCAVERVDELRFGQGERHGVDGEVAPGQVGLDTIGVPHHRLAGVGAVHLGPVGGDLEAPVAAPGADRAEPLALGPGRVGPSGENRLGVVRPGVGGEVDVGPVEVEPEQQVSHDPADEVETVAGRGEPLGQRPRLVQDGPKPLGDHRCGGYGSAVSPAESSRSCTSLRERTTLRPGPPAVIGSDTSRSPASAATQVAVDAARASRS